MRLAGVRDLSGDMAGGELPGAEWVWGGAAGEGCWLLPSMVDLCCEAGYPGFPERERPETLAAAALAGGFLDLVLSPAGEPARSLPEQVQPGAVGAVRLHEAAAATVGEQLSEVGLLLRRGAVAISDGGAPIGSTRVLRSLLEYVGPHGAPVLLRGAEPELDAVGVVHESGVAAQLGLRGNPVAAEEIGICRVLALLRGVRRPPRVHLTHVQSAAGLALVRAARGEGLSVTASTAARSLLLDEEALLGGVGGGEYDTRLRLHPPLRGRGDRAALVAAVAAGELWLAADHRPRAPEEKEQCFEQAAPGSTGLEWAVAAAYTALRGAGLGVEGALRALVAAMSAGPLGLIGRRAAGWVVFEPEVEARVEAGGMRSLARNEALAGRSVRGVVRGVIRRVG